MKRELGFAAVAAVLLSVGCGGKHECTCPTAAPIENTAVAEAPEPEPAPAPAPPVVTVGRRPDNGFTTGSPECDHYLWLFDQVVERCATQMGPALDAMKQSREAQREAFGSWDALDAESRKATLEAASTGCASASEALVSSAKAMECVLQ
jgi:hypothetical protein